MASGTISFPANPTVGQTYTFNNTTWVWNGTVWTVAPGAASGFLPLSGGQMTGPLTLAAGSVAERDFAVQGITDGSAAVAGDVGEFLTTATVLNTGSVSGGPTSVATLTLTPGVWLTWGNAFVAGPSGTVTLQNMQQWITAGGANYQPPDIATNPVSWAYLINSSGPPLSQFCLPSMRYYNVSASTQIWLTVLGAVTSGGAATCNGVNFNALRIR
jgi:hypothetical protein